MKNNYCIYRHIRLDTNKVFYIGIGDSIRRPFAKYQRNKYWNNIINKTDYEIQILKKDLTWEDACELEKILINYYGKKCNKTGILCNITDGGDGNAGIKLSEETKRKIGLKSKNRILSKETRLKMSEKKTFPVINTVTLEIIYNTDKLANDLNISKRYFCQMMSNERNNKTFFKYLKDYETNNN